MLRIFAIHRGAWKGCSRKSLATTRPPGPQLVVPSAETRSLTETAARRAGVVVEKVEDDPVDQRRLLHQVEVRRARHDGQFGVRYGTIQLDGVFEGDSVVVPDQDQRRGADA